MDNNRLHLNFNNTNNADRLSAADRAYPTTPSTFPQPVFPPPNSQQQQQGGANGQANNIGMASSSQQSQYAAGYASPHQQQQQGGYFSQGQYGGQQYASSGQQQGHQGNDYGSGNGPLSAGGLSASASGNSLYAPRSNTPGASDPNTGLAHQFSHQNLGGGRAGGGGSINNYSNRAPASAAQRPRTAGATGYQPAGGYNSYLNAPLPNQPVPSAFEFQIAPERNPDRFGPNANNNQKKCSQLAADFFKDSVKRARERNQR